MPSNVALAGVLSRRSEPSASDSPSFGPIYIAGVSVVGALLLGVCIWLSLRLYRKRLRQKREGARGAAFLSVKGLVKEDGQQVESNNIPSGAIFSREQASDSVVFPDKVLAKPPSRDDIIQQHRESGTFPRPFSIQPFSFAMNASISISTRPPSVSNSIYSQTSNRLSNLLVPPSPTWSQRRFSVMSTTSSLSSAPTTGHPRKVRQLSNPVLPDELTISLGERLTVVESFDDGWCLVGRENSIFSSAQKSLFGSSQPANTQQQDVELGVVPAWVFIKPVKGLRAERPVRSTSLGITVNIDSPGGPREQIMSWSNF